MAFNKVIALIFSTLINVIVYANNVGEPYEPIVRLLNMQGKIRGHVLKSASGRDYYAFQEIPYAAPPIGEYRFKFPQEPDYWQGILNCTKNTKVCMQDLKSEDLEVTEDCLYLNVYTPVKPEDSLYKRLPVLIWVHGGGFKSGGGIFQNYNPKYFMDQDVVVVTMNYRLGPFGFLTLQDKILPPNIAIRDQWAAVSWVIDNIAGFGGHQWTMALAGGGAGAASVGYISIGPSVKGQVVNMILQGGTPLSSFYYQSNPVSYAFAMGNILGNGFNVTYPGVLLKLLQNATSSEILEASKRIQQTNKDQVVWAPVYDPNEDSVNTEGRDSYLPNPAIQCFETGAMSIFNTLIGFNSEEALSMASSDNFKELAAEFDSNPHLLVNDLWNVDEANKTVMAQKLKSIYTNSTFAEDLGAFVRYKSDSNVRLALIKQADIIRRYSRVFLYEFSYKGKLGKNVTSLPGTESVSHGEEINYMWDDGTHPDINDMDDADRLTINRTVKLWVNFIRSSNPTPDDEDDLLQNVKWPRTWRYDPIAYLNINSTLQVQTQPERYEQARAVIDEYSQSPRWIF